jgi:hypothetical protein
VGQEPEPEVPAGDPAMGGGVRGELADDVFGGPGDTVRQVLGAQPFDGEEPGETGAAWRGGQQDAEAT